MSPRRPLLVAVLALLAWHPQAALAVWGPPVEAGIPAGVPSLDPVVSGVSCAAPGNCGAIGAYMPEGMDNNPGLLLSETAGSWGSGITPQVPRDAQTGNAETQLNSISCAAPGECLAGGHYFGRQTAALLFHASGGAWGPGVVPVPEATWSDITSVSCPAVDWCAAVGTFDDQRDDHALLLEQRPGDAGTPTAAVLPPDAAPHAQVELDALSCSSPGNCSAVGKYIDTARHQQGLIVTEAGGSWNAASRAPLPAGAGIGPAVELRSISCPSDGHCAAVGTYEGQGGGQGLLLNETSGVWTAARAALPPDAARRADTELDAVSCAAVGECTAVGTYDSSGANKGLMLSQRAGVWGRGVTPLLPPLISDQEIGLSAVSCSSPGNCVAVGQYHPRRVGQGSGLVLVQRSGTWRRGGEPPRPANHDNPGRYGLAAWSLQGVSCVPTGECAIVGSYVDRNERRQGLLDSLTPGAATPALALSVPGRGQVNHRIRPSAATATLSRAVYPSGGIRFAVIGPRPSVPTRCSGGARLGTAAVRGALRVHPPRGFAPKRPGTYWWFARYSGDAENDAAASSCGAALAKTVVAR